MEAVLLVIHLIVAVGIIIVVLIQPSEAGGFLGSGGGSMSNMMMPRRSADLLTRVTTILAGCFFLTSLFLAILAGHKPKAASILEHVETPPAAEKVEKAPAPEEKKTGTPKAPISK